MSDWRDEARELLPRIDPFFKDVLIVDRSECPGEVFTYKRDWFGLSGPTIGSALGRPGVAGILVDDELLREYYADATAEELRIIRLALVLHEASHAVEFGRSAVDKGHPLDSRIVEVLSEAIRNGKLIFPPDEPGKPWDEHGAMFHRLVLHIFRRASMAGARVRLPFMHICAGYGLSKAGDYLESLGDEPERLTHLSLFEIRDVPPPAAFCDLWHHDTGEEINAFPTT